MNLRIVVLGVEKNNIDKHIAIPTRNRSTINKI